MQARLVRAFWVAMILLAVAGCGYLTVRAVDRDPAVFGSVIAASGAAVLAIAQRRWEKKQELERLHREEIAPVYEELVDLLKDADKMAAGSQNERFFRHMTTKLLIHGSPAVIGAWIRWRSIEPPEDPDDLSLVLGYEGVLRAIRHDLGHDDTTLGPGDLLRTYINDMDAAVVKWQTKTVE